jgi:PTH1 family peptidyl-tRNA hydrolase
MDWQRVVVGIGNPGAEYEDTRHNVGFVVLDRVAEARDLSFHRLERRGPDGARAFGGRVKAKVAAGRGAQGVPFLLVKPQTYVNLSGDAVGPLLRAASLGPQALFVVVDDLHLPLGRIRVRPAGSSGGHNGLRSIEQALGTNEYPRLRLGIGKPGTSEVTDHVLGSFAPDERELFRAVVKVAADAVAAWLDGASIAELMDRCNGPGSVDEENL